MAGRRPDTLIIARTDARTTHELGEAIRRGRAYAQAGADVIFVRVAGKRGGTRRSRIEHTGPDIGEHGGDRAHPVSFRRAAQANSASRSRSIQQRRSSRPPLPCVSALTQLRRHGRIEDISQLASLEEYHRILDFSLTRPGSRFRASVASSVAVG